MKDLPTSLFVPVNNAPGVLSHLADAEGVLGVGKEENVDWGKRFAKYSLSSLSLLLGPLKYEWIAFKMGDHWSGKWLCLESLYFKFQL